MKYMVLFPMCLDTYTHTRMYLHAHLCTPETEDSAIITYSYYMKFTVFTVLFYFDFNNAGHDPEIDFMAHNN